MRVGTELIGLVPSLTPLRQDLSLPIEDRHAMTNLCHEDGFTLIEPQLVRLQESSPFPQVSAVSVEYLDAVVVPVADIDLIVGVNPNAVDEVELSWASPGLSPTVGNAEY